MKETWRNKIYFAIRTIIVCILAFSCFGALSYAWYKGGIGTASYAPVSSPEALYIGAGHRDAVNDTFEDIRYMYFNGMDAEGADYVDRVFCIFGKAVSGYKLQLAYTTNNPFSYSIFHATESSVSSAGAVAYVTHQSTPQTYYYSVNGAAISGTFLNKTVEDGKDIATSAKHTETYGSYSSSYVHKNAEPIYWQTSAVEEGDERGDFVNYYILRVYKNGKTTNDRETDVLCIAAKAFSYSG